MSTPPVTAPAKTAQKTTYVLLARQSDGEPWTEATQRIQANTPDQAIKAYVAKLGEHAVTQFVAVPARSWAIRKASVETVSKVSLS